MKYDCYFFDDPPGQISWHRIESISLVEVVTGAAPRLETSVKACWSEEALFIRFMCEDDHTVATMTNRDDPLFLEDVVEVFLDLTGTGEMYYEFEVSPRNVVFDAMIKNDLQGHIDVDTSWDANGLETTVRLESNGRRTYEMKIPFTDIGQPPSDGIEWRWNAFRIDDDPQGNRHYWAWSPTGAVQFHLPRKFGILVFHR
ncbi:carbohydrate-binding family 9-like protein [Paenibacillus sp. N3.4]|uniref:carbohydrate-binding family 9-like protein n=1 Tax=Paenibacillus sp. N3.4 TaxID=2603222 RepID=UPI00164FF4D7|nr:carbohydrate-binding family 9-like protein [Paenibacillus sp. N3.4]